MLALGLEEEGVPAPDVAPPAGTVGLEQLRDLRGGGDRVADHATADVTHHVGDRTVSMDDGFQAWVPVSLLPLPIVAEIRRSA